MRVRNGMRARVRRARTSSASAMSAKSAPAARSSRPAGAPLSGRAPACARARAPRMLRRAAASRTARRGRRRRAMPRRLAPAPPRRRARVASNAASSPQHTRPRAHARDTPIRTHPPARPCRPTRRPPYRPQLLPASPPRAARSVAPGNAPSKRIDFLALRPRPEHGPRPGHRKIVHFATSGLLGGVSPTVPELQRRLRNRSRGREYVTATMPSSMWCVRAGVVVGVGSCRARVRVGTRGRSDTRTGTDASLRRRARRRARAGARGGCAREHLHVWLLVNALRRSPGRNPARPPRRQRASARAHTCARACARICVCAPRTRARAPKGARAAPSDTACSPSHATRPRRAPPHALRARGGRARARARPSGARASLASQLTRTIAGRSSHATVAPGDAADCVCMRERTSVRRTQQSCAYPTDVRTVRQAAAHARNSAHAHAHTHARTSARNYAHNNHSRTHAHAHAAHVRAYTHQRLTKCAYRRSVCLRCATSGASHSTSHRPAPSRSTCGGPIARMRTSAAPRW